MSEIWKECVQNNAYSVSNRGRVYSTKSNKVLKPVKSNGYLNVSLCAGSGTKPQPTGIHVLVLAAFKPQPENMTQVNHIDGVKTNNKLDNLEWSTASLNGLHAYKTGLWDKKKLYRRVRLYEGDTFIDFKSNQDAAKYLGVSTSSISKGCNYIGHVHGLEIEYIDAEEGDE